MIWGCKVVLFAALGQMPAASPEADASALILELGSAKYATREAAARGLQRIGRPALAALRGARHSRDPEIRTRAGVLAQKIESALLTQASWVRLDFDNRTLPDVVKSLSEQAGFKIELYPANNSRWRQRKVQLRAAEPVEFWKAIDRVCDAGNLQYNTAMHGHAGPGEPSLSLTEGVGRIVTPISDSGPFRVSLVGVDYQRHLTYGSSIPGSSIPPRPRPAVAGVPTAPREPSPKPRLSPITNVQFSAQLLVAAEPRLIVSNVRRLNLVEAVDDLGQSLIPAEDLERTQNRHAGFLGMATGPIVQIQAQLRRPAASGTFIKKLRGSIPLTVSSRQPNPIVVLMNNAKGKTYENQETSLTVHDIKPSSTNRNLIVELSLKAKESEASNNVNLGNPFSDAFQRADPQHLQIEALDDSGHLIPWFQSGTDVETGRFALTLADQGQLARVKELRYYSLTRAAVNVPFEFTDIPMP